MSVDVSPVSCSDSDTQVEVQVYLDYFTGVLFGVGISINCRMEKQIIIKTSKKLHRSWS